MKLKTLATALSLSTLCTAPGFTKAMTIPQSQAEQGLSVPVTFDIDLPIQFPGSRIRRVYNSHGMLFNPRYDEGGNLLLLQATATPKDLALLPELGRPLGTVTVELENGTNLFFHLKYSKRPHDTVITVQKPTPPPAAVEQEKLPIRGQVTQSGFTPPFRSPILPRTTSEPILEASSIPNRSQSQNWWLLTEGLKNQSLWASSPNKPAYRVFFTTLKEAKDEGATFERALPLAKRLSGLGDGDLTWLSRALSDIPPANSSTSDAAQASPATPTPSPIASTSTTPPTPSQEASPQAPKQSPPPSARSTNEQLARTDYVIRGTPQQILSRIQIPMSDGSEVSADKLLAIQPRIWTLNRGSYRKSFGYFINALVKSKKPTSKERLEDALNRVKNTLSLNDIQKFAKEFIPESSMEQPLSSSVSK